jgi:hypothetical protein
MFGCCVTLENAVVLINEHSTSLLPVRVGSVFLALVIVSKLFVGLLNYGVRSEGNSHQSNRQFKAASISLFISSFLCCFVTVTSEMTGGENRSDFLM